MRSLDLGSTMICCAMWSNSFTINPAMACDWFISSIVPSARYIRGPAVRQYATVARDLASLHGDSPASRGDRAIGAAFRTYRTLRESLECIRLQNSSNAALSSRQEQPLVGSYH